MMFSFKAGFAPPIPVRHPVRNFPDQSVYKSVLQHHADFGNGVEEKHPCDDVTQAGDDNQQSGEVQQALATLAANIRESRKARGCSIEGTAKRVLR